MFAFTAFVTAVRLPRVVRALLPAATAGLIVLCAMRVIPAATSPATSAVTSAVTSAAAALAAGAVAAINSGYAIGLLRRARRPARKGAAGRDASMAGQDAPVPGRGAGLLGLGLLCSGLAGALVAVKSLAGTRSEETAWIGFGGLIVATSLYLPAMVIRSALGSTQARVRCGLDGVGCGVFGLFTVWLLVIAPHGVIGSRGFWVALLTSAAVGVAVVVGLATPRGDPTGLTGPAAVALSVLGLAGLTMGAAPEPVALPLWLAALAMIAAPVVAWRSAPAQIIDSARTGAMPRMLVVPGAAAFVVALHRSVDGGDFDHPSAVLGIMGITALVARSISADLFGFIRLVRDATRPGAEEQRAPGPAAYLDERSGLAGRRQAMLAIAGLRCRSSAPGTLLRLKIDGIVGGSDQQDYAAQDRVLTEVARRMRAEAHDGDVTARLGRDEFAIVTDASPVRAYAMATQLVQSLAEPVVLPGEAVHLTAWIGLTDLGSAASAHEVLRRAGVALWRARRLRGGHIEWFDGVIEAAMLRRMTLEMDLPGAMLRGELDVVYQPIVDLVRQRPVAVEALLRWRHPTLHTVLPAEVLPIAQELGLITEIGNWVLYQSARQLAAWLRDGRNLCMAVNVSPTQLHHRDLHRDLAGAIELNDLPAHRIVIEVAGASLDPGGGGVADALGRIRSMGVQIAWDEFAGNDQGLAHLRHLPVDQVKIGRPLFAGTPAPAAPSIDVTVGQVRRLGIDVVAHGLEQGPHLATVRAAGCRFGQGHLFARPQPAERTEAYLDGFLASSG